MTQLSRRFFLGGLLAVGAATVIQSQKMLPLKPALWADGIHDDTAALQALLDGKPVDILNDGVRLLSSDNVSIFGGKYRITDTLIIRRDRTVITNCSFICDDAMASRSAFYMCGLRGVELNVGLRRPSEKISISLPVALS